MIPEEIRGNYLKVISRIEADWGEYDVPPDVQNYYLLSELIALGNFDSFISRYGRIPIDPDFAGVGKSEFLGLGDLSNFEIEACELWNQFVSKIENTRR